MKALKMFVLVAVIAFSSAVSASTNPVEKADETNELITKTVSKLLENPYFELNENTKAMVKLAINKDNELVVLSVDTENKNVENYIKSRLNYKKVSEELGRSRYYEVPVKMLKSE
ncbi:MAG: hypothetical protein ED556_10025 [Winogradskyella sp.]|uniref:hypothetical protein n=1 Tax=Winogradskyella sp. TaxID=1883156 RepID=UPI000F3B58BC|nr:hypothetical protein [Winogradskyella sp.]RNC84911.1 MAG: hypothetical protein ED556_10025 [Winogradskyella sp.]